MRNAESRTNSQFRIPNSEFLIPNYIDAALKMIGTVGDSAVALQTVVIAVVNVAHGLLVTSQTILVDHLSRALIKFNSLRIVSHNFVVHVDHTSAALLNEIDGAVVVRQMTFNAVLLSVT